MKLRSSPWGGLDGRFTSATFFSPSIRVCKVYVECRLRIRHLHTEFSFLFYFYLAVTPKRSLLLWEILTMGDERNSQYWGSDGGGGRERGHHPFTLMINDFYSDRWMVDSFLFWALNSGWVCSSLVEHRTVMPLMEVRFPGAARNLSPRVNFQCRLFYVCPYTPRVQSHALTSVRTLKILWSMSEFDGLWKH